MEIFEDRRRGGRRSLEGPAASLRSDDEIDLIDLLIILIRHKWAAAGVFGLTVFVGAMFAFLKPETFTYTTSIQIANGVSGLIEPPGTVLAKLNESYIPFSLHAAREQSPGSDAIKITARIPKDSQIISLESFGARDDQARHARLHQAVIDQLIRDHNRVLDAIRLNLQAEADRVRRQLDAIKSEDALLQERAKKLDEQEASLQSQIAEVRKRIDQDQAQRRQIVQRGGRGSSELALLDGELGQLSQRESDLNNQLLASTSLRDDLRSKDSENSRLQSDLQDKLDDLNTKLASIIPTRSITPTLRSLHPTGVSGRTIIAVSLSAGVTLGLFAAFVAEFVARVRNRLRAEHA
jgi:uncharacterized protein involved in exopolysaccharide biosynthesis